MLRSNLSYAQEFFDVDTLETRNNNQLDFSEFYIGTVLRFIATIITEKNITLADNEVATLIHSTLWDVEEGDAIIHNSDSRDFHFVHIAALARFIKAVRAL